MPENGYYVLSDIIGRADMLELACGRCERLRPAPEPSRVRWPNGMLLEELPMNHDGGCHGLRAVVNTNFPADRADYDDESTTERLGRRVANWMPTVLHR